MQRPLAISTLALLLSLLLSPVTSDASHGGGGSRDFTVGGAWNSNPSGGQAHIGFAAHRGEPGFSGLVPAGDDLLAFRAFADAADSVTEIAQVGQGATGYEVAKGDLDGPGPLPAFMLEGPVTCLTVVGNRASFFYEFKHAEPSFLEGGGIQVYVEDNGSPANGEPDGTTFDPPIPGPGPGLPPLEGPTVCPPPRVTGYDPIESGNLIVHDATP